MRIPSSSLTLIVLLHVWPTLAKAQQREVPVTDRNCHGMLTAELASGRAHVDVGKCGVYVIPAVADAVRTIKTDTEASPRVERILPYAMNFRSPEIFNAALEVAEDESAMPYGRIVAMMIVLAQHDNAILMGGVRGFRRVYTIPMTERCLYDRLTDQGYDVDQPLGADYRARAAAALSRIRASSHESLLIRRFAGCAERFFRPVP